MPVPNIEWAGCREIEEGVCILGRDALTLKVWVDVHAASELEVELNGRPAIFERHGAAGGLRIHVALDSNAETLSILGRDPSWVRPWTLPIRRRPPPDVVVRSQTFKAAGDPDRARTELETVLPELDGLDRLSALEELRGLYHLQERTDDAVRLTAETANLAAALGQRLHEAYAVAAAAFQSSTAGGLAAAWDWVERLERLDALPEAKMFGAYYRGVVEWRTGDLAGAVRSIDRACVLAERLGATRERAAAYQTLASLLAEIGRTDDALRLVERALDLVDDPELPCMERAQLINSLGWAELLLGRSGQSTRHPYELFEDALAALDRDGPCPNAAEAANVRTNLALLALEEHEPDEALERLWDIDEMPEALVPWAEEVLARVGLDTGRTDLLPTELAMPDPGWSIGAQWNALEHQAEIRERWELIEAAIAADRSAEELVERGVAALGVSFGSELFLAGRQTSAQRLVRLLLDQGRVDEALCTARLARGRALRRLDRLAKLDRADATVRSNWNQAAAKVLQLRGRWGAAAGSDWTLSAAQREHRHQQRIQEAAQADRELEAAFAHLGVAEVHATCDDLPDWPRDETTLLLFPLDRGWAVFTMQAETLDARVIEVPKPSDLGSAARSILASIRAPMSRVRILPTGRAWEIPFANLPWGDGTLVDAAAIVYSLDLPPIERAHPKRALVVADPSGDLPNTQLEADAVAAVLRERGWEVLDRRNDAATRATLVAELERVSLLHYAGHGIYQGQDGWGGALVLPDGDRLEVADVLALPAVPPTVVLTGCETGQVSSETLEGGMNIGTAFLLAGTEVAVVSERRVDDTLARDIAAALFRHAGSTMDGSTMDGSTMDLAAALRLAQRAIRHQDPTLDWQTFRVVSR